MTCKRCPFEVQLTPFWSPIKHLLLYYFITNWFHVCYKLAFYVCICHYIRMFYLKICNDFSKRYLESLEYWLVGVGCLMLGVDDVSFGVLMMWILGCWVLDVRCWLNDKMVDKDSQQYELVFYMLFTVFKWLEGWFLDAFYS